jgi:cellulose synthase/poly-beta-1,6-N-acetylglucosamine synthase-like glycosyltransferase
LALEPSGNSAGTGTSGDESEAREPSLSPRAQPGFAEPAALFRPYLGLPVELRALHGLVDPVFLRWAASRAEAMGICADEVVARSAVIGADAMLEAYAADLGTDIDRLEYAETAGLNAEVILSAGVLPADAQHRDKRPTIALNGMNLRTVYALVERNPLLGKRFRITSNTRLRSLVERSSAEKLADDAAFGLRLERPEYSASRGRFNNYVFGLFAAMALAALSYYFALKAVFFAVEAALALTFLSWSALRIYACFIRPAAIKRASVSDKDLPIYTILVPLHREAEVAADLVAAISALNYPREKLDVKLILEADDQETIAAVRAINLDPCFEIFISPDRGPRTKPKALRAALPFSRGEFVVVYDAEDCPDPDQLRDAYSRFLSAGEKLACVQAKLAIDNKSSNFLTAHFRAEYSGLFEVLLPALVRLRLPVPLGGTSNHFRIDALRHVGGWDPHNVTEDADLGVRLARFGYATDVVDSTTWEEAPARLGAWLMQRTRWMKGWVQTYVVHMRRPALLYRQLGTRGFLAFQLLIGGTVLAALVHPIFVLWLIKDAAFGSLLVQSDLLLTAQKGLVLITLAGGYFGSGLLALVGLRRRGQISSAWIVLTIPFYWLLLSAAAWRAIWKLLVAPYQWEKTAHGVAARNRETRV